MHLVIFKIFGMTQLWNERFNHYAATAGQNRAIPKLQLYSMTPVINNFGAQNSRLLDSCIFTCLLDSCIFTCLTITVRLDSKSLSCALT